MPIGIPQASQEHVGSTARLGGWPRFHRPMATERRGGLRVSMQLSPMAARSTTFAYWRQRHWPLQPLNNLREKTLSRSGHRASASDFNSHKPNDLSDRTPVPSVISVRADPWGSAIPKLALRSVTSPTTWALVGKTRATEP